MRTETDLRLSYSGREVLKIDRSMPPYTQSTVCNFPSVDHNSGPPMNNHIMISKNRNGERESIVVNSWRRIKSNLHMPYSSQLLGRRKLM